MEHVEMLAEAGKHEHHELSVADLDISALYEWLDRPVTEEDMRPADAPADSL